MTDLRDLYQELIVDHSKRPRNFRRLEDANREAVGYNPLCGDKVSIFVRMDGDVIKDISFQGSGCAISTASASILTEALRGKTRAEAETMFDRFTRWSPERASQVWISASSPRSRESPSIPLASSARL